MGRLHAISCPISFRPAMWIGLRHLHAGRNASVQTLLATLALPIQALQCCKLEPAELHTKTSWPPSSMPDQLAGLAIQDAPRS